MSLTIRFAETAAERAAIFHLRYRVYVEEFGAVDYTGADHERRWLGEAAVRNVCLLYAELDGEVVATLRLQLGADDALTEEDAIAYELARFAGAVGPGQICILSRFIGPAGAPRRPDPAAAAAGDVRFCVAEGLALCLLDCRPHLLNLYQRLGYRTYCRPYSVPDYGLPIPLALLVDDRAHLAAVGSPFLPDAPAAGPALVLAALLEAEPPAALPAEAAWADGAEGHLAGLADEGHPIVAPPRRPERGRGGAGGRPRPRADLPARRPADHRRRRGADDVPDPARPRRGPRGRAGGGGGAGERGRQGGPPAGRGPQRRRLRGRGWLRVLYLRYRTLEELLEAEPRLAALLLLNLSRIMATKLLAHHR